MAPAMGPVIRGGEAASCHNLCLSILTYKPRLLVSQQNRLNSTIPFALASEEFLIAFLTFFEKRLLGDCRFKLGKRRALSSKSYALKKNLSPYMACLK